MYIPRGAAEGNIYHKPGMSHYIPCLIAAEGNIYHKPGMSHCIPCLIAE
jgi:hypothetical protein